MVKQPTLSVAIPNYNHAQFLGQTLQSILDQSLQPKEIIVVDDGSTDNSVEIIESFVQKHPTIRLVQNDRNMGISYTCRRALDLVTGDYFLCGSSDDTVIPEFFKKSIDLLVQYPQAGFCATPHYFTDEKGAFLSVSPEAPYYSDTPCYIPPEKALKFLMKKGNFFCGPAFIYRTQALRESKGWPAEVGEYLDVFGGVLLLFEYGACFIPEPLGTLRCHSGNVSTIYKSEPKEYLKLVEPVQRLMTSPTYDHIIPPPYVEDVIKRDWYAYGNIALNKLKEAQSINLEYLNNSLPDSLLDQIFLITVQFFFKANQMTSQFYLFLRLRNFNGFMMALIFDRIKNRVKSFLDKPFPFL